MANEIYATLETTLGTIRVRLLPDEAPMTVENFVGLAKGTKEWIDPQTGQKVRRPMYDGTIFHRVIPKASDGSRTLGQEVDDLALALIAPLGADHDDILAH